MKPEELKNHLPNTCQDFHNSTYWEQAYDLYNETHADKVRKGCSSCCRKVLKWIKSQ